MSLATIPQSKETRSKESCFYNSTSSVCTRKEVITIVVLGVLTLLMAGFGLYGYLFDPSWLSGAHVLTGFTLTTIVFAGALVLLKYIQNYRHKMEIL